MAPYYVEVRTKPPKQPHYATTEMFPADQLRFINLENVDLCKFLNNEDVNTANSGVKFEVYDNTTQTYWTTDLSFSRTLPWEHNHTENSLYGNPEVFKNEINLSANLLKKAINGIIPWDQSRNFAVTQFLVRSAMNQPVNDYENRLWGVKNLSIFC